jgi:tetratricopeptide (TPR) repeat protein
MRSLIVALLVVLSPTARAESVAEARHYYNLATKAFALGHYADAAEAYEKSYENKPDLALLYNAAQAHRLAGNKWRALTLYQNYLRVYGRKVGNRAVVEEQIRLLEEAIATDERTTQAPPLSLAPRPESLPENGEKPEKVEPERKLDLVVANEPPPVDEPRPLVKRPVFWVVLVGAVVLVAAGVGLGVAFGGGSPAPPMASWGIVKGN